MSHRIPPTLDEADTRLPLDVPRWRLVQVIGGREKRAVASMEEALKPRGLAIYMPAETFMAKRGRKELPSHRALFRGYVFAEARDADLHLFRGLDAVKGLLSRMTAEGPKAVVVDAGIVGAWLFAEAMGEFDSTIPPRPKPTPKWERGLRVLAQDGPMRGRIGEIVKLKGQKRAQVLFEAIGHLRPVKTSVEIGLLAAA